MRGKEFGEIVRVVFVGITPAYAGKSAVRSVVAVRTGDHPRVCGEKPLYGVTDTAAVGSPPRMRGKVLRFRLKCIALGITPAYAGKRVDAWHMIVIIRDHPRVCGEKCSVKDLVNMDLGSPPRMRGKAVEVKSKWDNDGITPAYAGKSWTLAGRSIFA